MSESDEEGAWGALGRWVDVHPFNVEVHRHVVEMARERKATEELARSWRALILLERVNREAHYRAALKDFAALKMTPQIEAFTELAREEGVDL